MTRAVHYDGTTGDLLGFYEKVRYPNPPTPFIDITDDEWQDCLNNAPFRKVDTTLLTLETITPTVDIVQEQTDAKSKIDYIAENARKRYLTTGAGQAITYQEKADQATDYVAAGYPVDLTNYPFIQAEVNALSKTATQAADDILARRSAWIAVGAQIEEARLSGKAAVDAATTTVEIGSARDIANAALNNI